MIIPRSISISFCWLRHITRICTIPFVIFLSILMFLCPILLSLPALTYTHTRKYSHLHTNSTLSCWILFHPTHAFTHFILLLKQPWINSRFLYYNDNMNITLCLLLFKTNSLPLFVCLCVCVSLRSLCIAVLYSEGCLSGIFSMAKTKNIANYCLR